MAKKIEKPSAPVQDHGPDNVRKVDALAPVENFDPRKNLRTVTNGVWRYICEDINAIKDECFDSPLARDFGIKKNDLIYLVGNKKHRIVVV